MELLNTLYELLQNSVKKYSDKIAFSMLGGEDVTYNEVGQRVKQVQDLLVGAGLKAGDKVITAGGIYAVVKKVEETSLLIEVDSNVTLRIDKNMVVAAPVPAEK